MPPRRRPADPHRPRRGVRSRSEDLRARGDDPDLDVTADDILVLRNAGPKGAPGMPEAGSFPIPMKLARAGVKDMIRISDARMSGTAFGTIVLHIAPEAAVGGPLALVQDRRPHHARRAQAQDRAAGRRRTSSPSAARPGRHRRRIPAATAATPACSTGPCCRPTKASTSTSSGDPARSVAMSPC